MLYLFNSTIMPNEGVFINRKVSRAKAISILQQKGEFVSALGHQGSVDAFNSIFPELNCEVNRIQVTMYPGDEALCIKVLGRLQEGKILTLAELESIGFEFYYIKCFEIGEMLEAWKLGWTAGYGEADATACYPNQRNIENSPYYE